MVIGGGWLERMTRILRMKRWTNTKTNESNNKVDEWKKKGKPGDSNSP